MAHKEIPEIPAADTLDGTEQFHIVQDGNSRRMTLAELRTYALEDYTLSMGWALPPTNPEVDDGEAMFLHVFTETVNFADDFAGSQGYAGTPPDAQVDFAVLRDQGAGAVQVGTITIADDGSVTFATTGDDVTFVPGDALLIVALATDESLLNYGFSFKGTRA